MAFDLDEKTNKLAGFAIKCTTPSRGPYHSKTYRLKNRPSLSKEITRTTETVTSTREHSNKAPFQLFHWTHYPGSVPGEYVYTVYACYFRNGDIIDLGSKATIRLTLGFNRFSFLDLGFTRGYVSSQSFQDRFGNDPTIEPKHRRIIYDTAPYLEKYRWLGSHAGKLVFEFLKESSENSSIDIDVFAYDFDEPDVIRALTSVGSRARVFQDNHRIHTNAGSIEPIL